MEYYVIEEYGTLPYCLAIQRGGEKMKINISINYQADEIILEIDKEIERFMEYIGAKRWASGYNLIEKKRDLAFDMNIEVELEN